MPSRTVTSFLSPRVVVTASLLLFLIPAHPALAQDEPAPADTGKDDPALEQYYVANGAYNRKLSPVAIQQYQAFLKDHPEHAKADLARRGLALSHYASKQYKAAIGPLTGLLAKETLDASLVRAVALAAVRH